MKARNLVAGVITATVFFSFSSVFASSVDAYKRVKRDSGGVPKICHYYDDGRYQNYTFKCYNDMGIRGITFKLSPLGSHVSKTVNSSHRLFDSAKSSVDDLGSDLDSATNDLLGFGAAAAVEGGALFSKNVRLAIEAGLAIGIESYATYTDWMNAKESLRKAYGYIDNM